MTDEPKRWSGYATQSAPWQQGYEWAHDRGEHAALGCEEAGEALGYDFDSPDDHEFMKGCEFGLDEVGESIAR